MAAIEAKFLINNRSVKRSADKEVRKVWNIIEQIAYDFENAIFNAPKWMSYEYLYEQYLSVWQKAMEKLANFSLKYIKINSLYFSEQYKPLEYLL